MELVKVIVHIEGGVIHDVDVPAGVRVVVRDCDIDGIEEDRIVDDEYFETTYDGPESGPLPALLVACERAEDFISGFEDDDTQEGMADLLGAIRNAIANAKGETTYDGPESGAAGLVQEELRNRPAANTAYVAACDCVAHVGVAETVAAVLNAVIAYGGPNSKPVIRALVKAHDAAKGGA
jgi:hypothetical protein